MVAVIFNKKKKSLQRIFIYQNQNKHFKSISLIWAWHDYRLIENYSIHIDEELMQLMVAEKRTLQRFWLRPLNVIAISFIVFYQHFLRPTDALDVGLCKATPNCSNFAIGCFLRYSFWLALSKSIIRVDACSNSGRPSFSENFR